MPGQYQIVTASHQQQASQDCDVPNEPAAKLVQIDRSIDRSKASIWLGRTQALSLSRLQA